MTHVQYWCVASETVYYKYPLTKVLDEGYTYVSNYATIATVDIETLAERTVGSALHQTEHLMIVKTFNNHTKVSNLNGYN